MRNFFPVFGEYSVETGTCPCSSGLGIEPLWLSGAASDACASSSNASKAASVATTRALVLRSLGCCTGLAPILWLSAPPQQGVEDRYQDQGRTRRQQQAANDRPCQRCVLFAA